MMRRWMVAATALAGFALTGAHFAAAQSPGGGMGSGQGQGAGMGRGPGQAQGRGSMLLERVEMFDADGDGLIQRAELTDWRARVFDAMDADGDDALHRDEYMAVQLGRGADAESRGPRYAEMQAAKAAEFDAMDADRDDIVAREPFIAYAGAMFDEADSNADGALAPAEFQAMHQGT